MRKSGKRGLVVLERYTAPNVFTSFDLSGVSTAGLARANEYNFSIEGNTTDVMGYGDDWTQEIATGQSKWEAEVTAFYNAAPDETNHWLWRMFQETHMLDPVTPCAERPTYKLLIYPEGNCAGKEKWTFDSVILKSFEPTTPVDDVMTVSVSFAGRAATREITPATLVTDFAMTITLAPNLAVAEFDTPYYRALLDAQARAFVNNLAAGVPLDLGNLQGNLDSAFTWVEGVTVTIPAVNVTAAVGQKHAVGVIVFTFAASSGGGV